MSDEEEPIPPTQPTRRQAFAELLLGLVGLTAPAEAYLDLVDPAGSPAEQREVAKESDCMLVALGAEELFFACARTEPYVNGSAPRLLEERAGGSPMVPGGAMRLASPERPPAIGDALWWGKGASAPEHVEHVVDVRFLRPDATSLEADVVAGGERDGEGRETVRKLVRSLRWTGRRYVDPRTGRPIIGLVDCDLLATRLGVRSEGE